MVVGSVMSLMDFFRTQVINLASGHHRRYLLSLSQHLLCRLQVHLLNMCSILSSCLTATLAITESTF